MREPVVQARGLVKRYGALTVVDDLSLDLFPQEILGLLGPNGAGKTTTISMICGLLKPDAGSISLFGEQQRPDRTRIGICPQETILWERLTCLEQLEFMGRMYGVPSAECRKRGARLLDDLGLSDKRDQQARRLSGGMKRRLSIALALVHEPEVIVLDEPEAGLDPQSRVLVRDYIRQLSATRAIILTTHNMDEADRLAQRIAIIDHGCLLALDTPAGLKTRHGGISVITVTIHDGLSEAQMAIRALPDVDSVIAADYQLQISTANVRAALPRIIAALDAGGSTWSELHIAEPTLEDVFIKLTGRRLRE